MLPAAHRLRRSVDFERAVRRGARAGRSTVVVHLVLDPEGDGPPQVGLVVSKAVGNAVHRNQVKRRLRHAARRHLASLPHGARVVVRALPPAAGCSFADLDRDLDRCLARAVERVDPSVGAAR
ncbi:ribonuclease P protein component [Isoptericola hypogeus]|uniref:Ribonuclease P protein component n=1 Tax=Isoptericola hypogeus TaxID=300179 RepID=A0ABP4VDX3_9MICO